MPAESLYNGDFTKDFLVKNTNKNNIVFHISNTNISEFNSYAKYALENNNDAKKRSKDEAASIHIITSKLNTKLNILYESQICEFYGKPDFIIRLGKNLYIMVSTTQALNKRSVFTQYDADRLMKKKLIGICICSQNLECLVDKVIDIYSEVRPVLHILASNIENANMCMISYKNIITQDSMNLNCMQLSKILKNIKIVITLIINHNDILK